MVQSQPDKIINGTNAVINALCELRSPSLNAGGFSRFSSQATTLNNAILGPSSQYPVYSYPLPPPPPSHCPPPLYLPPPLRSPPPIINLPCPPSIGGSRGQKGKCRSPLAMVTDLLLLPKSQKHQFFPLSSQFIVIQLVSQLQQGYVSGIQENRSSSSGWKCVKKCS